MKNEKIAGAWDKMKPSAELKEQILVDIMQKYNQKNKKAIFKSFKPAKIIATAAAVLLVAGLINIQTVIAFLSGLFFVPGIGLTDDASITYYGIEEPFEIETEYGIMKIEYISKVTQGGKTDLNIYMTTKDSYPASWIDPLVISAHSGGEMIFEAEVLDRAITHDAKAFFLTYRDFPDIDAFDLDLYGSLAGVSLKEISGEVAFSKENNGVTLAVQKVKGSETMYFTGIYGASIKPENYRFSGAMSRFHSFAYDNGGNPFDLLDGGAERFFHNGFSVGFHKNADGIKGFKSDRLELYYGKQPDSFMSVTAPIGLPTHYPFDIFELPVPKDGETLEIDIEIAVGQYIYRITSISREGDRLYFEDNSTLKFKYGENGEINGAVTWEPAQGTPEYAQAVENREYSIGWAQFICGDLTEDMPWYGWDGRYERVAGSLITGFDENAENVKLALVEILIYQYGNFDVEFE